MRVTSISLALFASVALAAQAPETPAGVRLEEKSWIEAEKLLLPDSVVVIPLGAALKEHGPHLKLRNDFTMAEYLARRVVAAAPVVVTPTLNYHFYPAFLEYPGSTSLTLETARDLTVQVARSLARYGPRRFYVLNTGISTNRALEPAAAALAREGILLRFTNLQALSERITAGWLQQERGSHADELETSMMLYIDPSSVDMKLAVRDIGSGTSPLTRREGAPGLYSPSGVFGDPTLATREKGRYAVEMLTNLILQEISQLRTATPPSPVGDTAPAPTAPPPPSSGMLRSPATGCLPGVERDLKRVEAAYNHNWNNRDHIQFGGMWSDQGDLVHPDGVIEKGRRTIIQNRDFQFRSREYRDARHTLTFGIIRCVDDDVAVVDGRWDLRDVTDAAGKVLPRTDGLATLVLRGTGTAWQIEAYRYHVRPGAPTPPMLLKKPGYPDKQ